jgi:uncharacterized protein YwgA
VLNTDDLALALIGRCGDRPEFGRTSLQKVAYLATAHFGWPGAGHEAHFFGPFSRTLERTTTTFANRHLINEIEVDLGFASAGGFPAKQYKYKLTELGSERLQQIQARHPDDVAELGEFVDQIASVVGALDQRTLSLAAKVHYIASREDGPISLEQVRLEAKKLGWKISEKQANQVATILRKLSLVN